mmetsp:Transcript_73536/g.212999  ORF Transcript_73536/g.212999 Transcript_73536/m.212999 type:complete len:210 (-) Transcript_73536:1075-1704(-)
MDSELRVPFPLRRALLRHNSNLLADGWPEVLARLVHGDGVDARDLHGADLDRYEDAVCGASVDELGAGATHGHPATDAALGLLLGIPEVAAEVAHQQAEALGPRARDAERGAHLEVLGGLAGAVACLLRRLCALSSPKPSLKLSPLVDVREKVQELPIPHQEARGLLQKGCLGGVLDQRVSVGAGSADKDMIPVSTNQSCQALVRHPIA